MKRLICLVLILLSVMSTGIADPVFVTASQLNGRARPSRKASVEARFDFGDSIEATGEWSKDHNWIQVEGGETGVVWVSIDYVSAIDAPYYAVNEAYRSVKIRKRPVDGKVTGTLKRGKKVEIDAAVLGWGHCSNGWIDLSYLEAVDDGE